MLLCHRPVELIVRGDVEMTTAIQRPLRGSRISSFYPVKTLPPISALDSAFQLQEYISLLIRLDVHDVETIVSIPGKSGAKEHETAEDVKTEEKDVEKDAESQVEKDTKGEVVVDKGCWIYEQLRRLAQDLSYPLITMLQHECSRATCPDMKAGEWQYLCVAHGSDGTMEQCCAIDYILHTLDSATALLNSPRAFPSRLSIPQASQRHFSSLARRLGRIFAHAYFHHREVFEQAEAESSLYARFLALTHKYDLVPSDFLVIPSRASHDDHDADVEPPRLLAAALDPQRERERSQWLAQTDEAGRDREGSPPGPAGRERNESPRKMGRSRTDTMVFSEAFAAAEELSKADVFEAEPPQPPTEQTSTQVDVSAGEVVDQSEPSTSEAAPEKPDATQEPVEVEAPAAPESDIADEVADAHVDLEATAEQIVEEIATDEHLSSEIPAPSEAQHPPSSVVDSPDLPESLDEPEAPTPSSSDSDAADRTAAEPTVQHEILEVPDKQETASDEIMTEAIIADQPSTEDSVATDPIFDATTEVEEEDIATAIITQEEPPVESATSDEPSPEPSMEPAVHHVDLTVEHSESDSVPADDVPATDDSSVAVSADAGSDGSS
ncbi:Mob1/phocein [Obba rivulosa]|uniref:Mob1/phocein n=1 Tax=Obba rivulosa TaxID=1052685 RepID=A0A8E2J2K6_9APHY|nr:Mob1/phocein [Obba rivulosa]